MRKIEIAGTGLTLQRSKNAPDKTESVLEYVSIWRIFIKLINVLRVVRASRYTAMQESFPNTIRNGGCFFHVRILCIEFAPRFVSGGRCIAVDPPIGLNGRFRRIVLILAKKIARTEPEWNRFATVGNPFSNPEDHRACGAWPSGPVR
ncbi:MULTISPECIES: hypothetical protein [Burkholderia cepacia complex]|uniref:hypothetical protein n=1 Tax=Burkholderia cepacia complex TaxID=87882 RepID=UPI001903FF98|nr:hypothetical protein [Burkholderia cenocepacia]MBJ9730985.1 hypothetical protein [Burkholderia cenocepacia]